MINSSCTSGLVVPEHNKHALFFLLYLSIFRILDAVVMKNLKGKWEGAYGGVGIMEVFRVFLSQLFLEPI